MKEYRNDDIIIYWLPELCAHPRICISLLPQVFNLEKRPWVNVNGASPKEIIDTIDKCPSGALRYALPEGSGVDPQIATGPGNINYEQSNPAIVKIKVTANGPLLVEGPAVLLDPKGAVIRAGSKMALCRCGLSGNRPFCNGEHRTQGWQPDGE